MASNEANDGFQNQYISPRTKNFYLNTDSADVYFICDGSNRIPAHKVLMSIACDAFNAMFHGDLRELGDIRIVDASADGFKEFLKFFYFDNIKLTMDHIEEVVYLCTKYIYSSSIRICEQFLLASLNTENICFSYGLAMTYDLIELKRKCEKIIAKNTLAVLQTAGFLECDKSVLAAVLKIDASSCNEIDVFKWCMAWVRATSEAEKVTRPLIDEHLGDSFRDIRFGSMTNSHLSELLSEYRSVFTVDERQEIDQLIASKDFHSVLFKDEPRPPYFIPRHSHLIEWPVQEATDQYIFRDLQEYESVTFSTREHISLGEIFLNEIHRKGHILFVELLILKKSAFEDDGNAQIVLQQVEKFFFYNQASIIKLHKPLVISPNFEYEVQLKIAKIPPGIKYLASYGLERYNRLMSEMRTKAFDRNTIIRRKSSERSLIESLNFNVISGKDFRL